MASCASRWKAPPVSAVDEEDSGRASSILDVFADMLTVNEDMTVAVAECQAEQDFESLIAYQRILHRDLMEMAEFIDAMFGVYGNGNDNCSRVAAPSRVQMFQTKGDEPEQPAVVDLTTESAGEEQSTTTEVKVDEPNKRPVKKAPRGALLKTIAAGGKVRETQRSKEQWVKSRHQVLEEEGVSAIMKENTSSMLEVPEATSGGKAEQEGLGGLALANQLRAHQHIAAFVKATTEATAGPLPTAPMSLLLANPLAMSTMTPTLAVPGSFPPPPPPLQPNTAGNTKVALPPAHMYNTYMPFAPLMFNPHAVGGVMSMPTWQPPMQAALPARPALLVRPPGKTPEFKRMCESCRKRHLSVRQCRLVLQHTDPEWQPAQLVPPKRRGSKKSTSEQVN